MANGTSEWPPPTSSENEGFYEGKAPFSPIGPPPLPYRHPQQPYGAPLPLHNNAGMYAPLIPWVYPPGRYPHSIPPNAVGPPPTSGGNLIDGPPPHPGKHEGKPTTWMPPIPDGNSHNPAGGNTQQSSGNSENLVVNSSCPKDEGSRPPGTNSDSQEAGGSGESSSSSSSSSSSPSLRASLLSQSLKDSRMTQVNREGCSPSPRPPMERGTPPPQGQVVSSAGPPYPPSMAPPSSSGPPAMLSSSPTPTTPSSIQGSAPPPLAPASPYNHHHHQHKMPPSSSSSSSSGPGAAMPYPQPGASPGPPHPPNASYPYPPGPRPGPYGPYAYRPNSAPPGPYSPYPSYPSGGPPGAGGPPAPPPWSPSIQGKGPPNALPPRPAAHYPTRSPHPPVCSYNGPPNYNGPPGTLPLPPPVSSSSGAPPPGSSPNYPANYMSHVGIPPTNANPYPGMGPPNNGPNNAHPTSPAPPRNDEKTSPATNNSGHSQAPPVTSPVATSASSDGIPVHDDTSQQSTLSQSSDRSDGGRQTPKGPHNFMNVSGGFPPPPGSPHSGARSPGAASMGSSSHESGYPRDMVSPGWQRTAASPVSAPTSRGRRPWLERLLAFMEEKGTPITQCPTISKNPLDLYKLYIYTRDRGGYIECNRNKSWKDIASQLGIAASSSGAYTLKKHYGKNLLPFECYFDRGGIDPGPILAQVEASGKKKGKNASNPSHPPPVPSPGSQDSRDSYSGSGTNSQEGYPGSYPVGPGGNGPNSYSSYPPNVSGDRPPSHPGLGPSGYPPQGPPPPNSGYGGYPPPRHSGPEGYPHTGSGYPPTGYPPPRPGWPPQGNYIGPQHPNGTAPPPSGTPPSSSASINNVSSSSGVSIMGPRGPYPPPQAPPSSVAPPTTQQNSVAYTPQGYPPPPSNDQYQPELQSGRPVILRVNQQVPSSAILHPSSSSSSSSSLSYSSSFESPNNPSQKPYPGSGPPPTASQPGHFGPIKSNPPSTGSPIPTANSGPRPGYIPYRGQRPPMYPPGGQPGWQNRYPGPPYNSSGAPDRNNWSNNPNNSGGPPAGAPRGPGPWGPERPPMASGYIYNNQPNGPPWNNAMMRPGMRAPFRPEMRPTGPPGSYSQSNVRPGFPGGRGRELLFPPGCVEATQPLLIKRRKYNKTDIQPVDGWRLVMTLKSGLLMESTWALDALNILLYDDNAFTYFGLSNMPGLLEAILEHWRSSLLSMFNITDDLELEDSTCRQQVRKRGHQVSIDYLSTVHKRKEDGVDSEKVMSACSDEGSMDMELGIAKNIELDDKVQILNDEEIFVTDEDRIWDLSERSSYDINGYEHWRQGGGNTTKHIITHYASGDLGLVPFVRVLKDLSTKKPLQSSLPPAPPQPLPLPRPEEPSPITLNGETQNSDVEDGQDHPKEEDEDIIDRIKRVTGIVFRDPNEARTRFYWEKVIMYIYHTQESQFSTGTVKQRNYDRGEDDDTGESCTSLNGDSEWWWEYLHVIRENVMVSIANIAGALELKHFDEVIVRPLLDGLLEWAISSSAYAQDPFPNVGPHSPISPQRLAIEALCKLSLQESNVDLILTNSGVARTIATADTTIGLLLGFIEQAEQNALVVAQQHGVNALRDNPDSMGTSLDMLRRAASTLSNLSQHPDNIPLFLRQEQRLLSLVMSQILDQGVEAILSNVLFNIGKTSSPPVPFISEKTSSPTIVTSTINNNNKCSSLLGSRTNTIFLKVDVAFGEIAWIQGSS
ncbi:ARID1 [Lepeophtheirus salmonis]|uniref:ARID1 n=1 Tax=Lepeophtheirus salmonis TaxID=72036 RepID=A0A7R8CED3_LEPSM|nr:ARID1 [Lepeophtheirus salmonis]CAF2794834.1 ARID1 [Lepeophtheirus salmonis]